tara:strand:+ start:4948 stop:5976 length:1029 start_codon:yes stop_codon:yes gene_type:complete
MAFANANYSGMLATTIENRSATVADNVTNNNALLRRLNQRGNVKTFSGGHKILQEISFAENKNAGWYSGYDLLPVGVSDVISAAEFEIKQAAVPVVMSGLEMIQNSGKEAIIDLMEARLKVAESTMSNLLVGGLYSDGTGSNGKQVTGLNLAVPLDPSTGTYGGINRANYTMWQSAISDNTAAAVTSSTIQGLWNTLWASLVRGQDRPDLIVCDSGVWGTYMASLQATQRFSNTNDADAGFVTVKFMDADVVLDGGMYGTHAATDLPAGDFVSGATGAPAGTAFFLNTDYLHWRPHARRNMVPLSPNRRYATNQDAEVQIMAWAGNLTCSGAKFQGRFDANG